MTDHHPDEPGRAERVLREALTARADTIEPSSGGLDRIEEELMTEPPSTGARNPWVVGALSAAAAVVLVLVAVAVFADDDGDETDVAADTTTTTTEEPSTSSTETTASTTSTTAFAPLVDPYGVAFPSPETARRFDSPQSVAQAYATDVLGFTELQVGEVRQGDNRSGEVPVTDRAGGRETTILVRQMDDDSWFVLGSTTENVTVDRPFPGDSLESPFETAGTALAFEGTVGVRVLRQDDLEPLGEGFVTGSGVPPAGPFEGEIEFEAPDEETPGVLVYFVTSPEDGRVTEAASFPVRLRPG
jgi:hypothetical protein